MSEPMFVTLRLGGKIRRGTLIDLVYLIEQYHTESDVMDDIVSRAARGTSATIYLSDVNYGDIGDVLAFCEENGIDYIYHCEAKWEADAILSSFIGGVLRETYSTQDGDPLLGLYDVEKIFRESSNPTEELIAAVTPPSLDKLEIVDV